MQNLQGKTAVVTGAASGLGKAFADRFSRAGMNIVMSDIEGPRLDAAVADVAANGTEVIGVLTDVSDAQSMDELGEAAQSTFGAVHVVCNNAGVAGGLTADGIDPAGWKWVLDVNLWGVIHGHRVFLPMLVEQGEGHIVNTASMAGHFPGHSAYTASKWAVVGITMGLRRDMEADATGVGVSCLCPGWVDTDIGLSDRNRPEWAAPRGIPDPSDRQYLRMEFVREALKAGAEPASVAELVHDAVVADKFWIFTDMSMVSMLDEKHASIMENRNPSDFRVL